MTEPIDPVSFKVFEVAGWELKAAGYDDFFGAVTSRVLEPLLDAVQVGSGTRVLDLATGPGYLAARAADRGAQVVGIDIADAMVSLARARYPGLDFRTADAEVLPFPESSFDAVVANFLVPHLARPERAALGIARVLAPGGRVALTTWDLPSHARFLGVFLDAVTAVGVSAPADLPRGPDFFRFSHDEAFEALLRQGGLAEVGVETITYTLAASSADALWDGLLAGTVRTSALIQRQPDDTQAKIRVAFDHLVDEYRSGDGLSLPVSVKMATGRRPG